MQAYLEEHHIPLQYHLTDQLAIVKLIFNYFDY